MIPLARFGTTENKTFCVSVSQMTEGLAAQGAEVTAQAETAIEYLNSVVADIEHKDWTGPAGPQGVPGIQGAMGPQGIQGNTGPQGLKGDTGSAGATGSTGPAGASGTTGAVGPTGPIGPTGTTGSTGAQGPAGQGIVLGTITTPSTPTIGTPVHWTGVDGWIFVTISTTQTSGSVVSTYSLKVGTATTPTDIMDSGYFYGAPAAMWCSGEQISLQAPIKSGDYYLVSATDTGNAVSETLSIRFRPMTV